MLRPLKLAALEVLRGSGVFTLVKNSRWRQQRLLILCYHGTSIEDEHEWRPLLYIQPQKLEERFQSLKKGNYSVLPLGEGLQQLHAGSLPPRSVAITFDDGTYDFFKQAYPLLKRYNLPATVYQTTYYTVLERPVFNITCSYMLWKRRDAAIPDGSAAGLPGPLDTRTEASRFALVRRLIDRSDSEGLTGIQRDAVAAQLARVLGIDYDVLKAKRILQLMNGRELAEVARNGIDVQLHTHRHRTPEDEALFRREIQDNRTTVHNLTGGNPTHFCYPSGVYRPAFLPWLQKENVVSATTCDAGLADRTSETMLLPRYVDHQQRTQLDFESWACGVGDLLAVRRKADQNPIRPQAELTDRD